MKDTMRQDFFRLVRLQEGDDDFEDEDDLDDDLDDDEDDEDDEEDDDEEETWQVAGSR
jgi:hypothetical protein